MAKKNASAKSGETKVKRPKRDWTKDRWLYVCAIELPTEGNGIETIKQSVKDAGGTITVRNRVMKRGKAGDEEKVNEEKPTNDEIEAAG